MRPIGFVKRIASHDFFTFVKRIASHDFFTVDKIYPYFEIDIVENDAKILIKDDDGIICHKWMYLEHKSSNNHHFDFYFHPEFPKDINQWTEDDWFQYDLKYGS